MTIQQVIDRVSELRSPSEELGFFIRCINEVERRIKREIVDGCEGREAYRFGGGYTFADIHRELIAPEPWDDIYVWGCILRLDQKENQIKNMNNSENKFDELLDGLARYWIRTHKPLPAPNLHSSVYGV